MSELEQGLPTIFQSSSQSRFECSDGIFNALQHWRVRVYGCKFLTRRQVGSNWWQVVHECVRPCIVEVEDESCKIIPDRNWLTSFQTNFVTWPPINSWTVSRPIHVDPLPRVLFVRKFNPAFSTKISLYSIPLLNLLSTNSSWRFRAKWIPFWYCFFC